MTADDIVRIGLALSALTVAGSAIMVRRRIQRPGPDAVARRRSLSIQIVPMMVYAVFWIETIGITNPLSWLAWLSRFAYLTVAAAFAVQQFAIWDAEKAAERNNQR